MSRDVMIDIETLGEPVLSIGACAFDIDTGIIQGDFYCVVDLESQLRAGLAVEASAFHWWLRQSDVARDAIAVPTHDPGTAIESLRAFVFGEKATVSGLGVEPIAGSTGPAADRVWAYPVSFDLSRLARLCSAINVKVPWTWTNSMDARTLWKLALEVDPAAAKIEKKATSEKDHHALADAIEQAGWVAKYWKIAMRGPA